MEVRPLTGRRGLSLVALAVSVLVAPAAAPAAKEPGNDSPARPQLLRLPAVIGGSTEGASTDRSRLSCERVKDDVWYEIASGRRGPILVRLQATGELDAVVAVFRKARSRLYPVACKTANAHGRLLLPFYGRRNTRYVIQVAEARESVAGTFRLRVFRAERPARPPGQALPGDGMRSAVHPLVDRDDAWSVQMERGRSYRINLVPGRGCLQLLLYRPQTYSFRTDEPVAELSCGGYTLFTPGPDGGGRYSLVVKSDPEIPNLQRYRLEVAAAKEDDLVPGVLLSSGALVANRLSGRGVDLIDLYRFGVAQPSEFRARLGKQPRAAFTITLLTPTGSFVRTVRSEENRTITLRKRLPRGHYYLAVRALNHSGGPYRLQLLVRVVTATDFSVAGLRTVETEPGQPQFLAAHVTPADTAGAVRFQFDRLDPLTGWHFVQTLDAPVAPTGIASATWMPPGVGYWRVHARFLGTLTAARSTSPDVRIVVSDPLD